MSLKCDILVSKFAFKFNFYRYTTVILSCFINKPEAGLYTYKLWNPVDP